MLSLNAQEKRSKRARLSVEARAAENAAAAQRMQVHRGQFTEEARVDANAQAAHRQYCQHCMGEYVNDCRLVIYLSTKLYFIGTVGIYEVRIGIIKNVGRLSPFLIGRERILHAYGHNRNSLGHREIQAG